MVGAAGRLGVENVRLTSFGYIIIRYSKICGGFLFRDPSTLHGPMPSPEILFQAQGPKSLKARDFFGFMARKLFLLILVIIAILHTCR